MVDRDAILRPDHTGRRNIFINVTTKFALRCDLSLSDDGSTIHIHLLCEGVRRECVVDTRGDGQVSLQIETTP